MTRMPVVYIPHGGGPWPFVDLSMVPKAEAEALATWLRALPASLPTPKALLVVSAHWEAPAASVTTATNPPLLFDYYGFPPESYRLTWPAAGSPALAQRVTALLDAAGFATAADGARGFDHGAFVPLKVAWPGAEIPTIQLSLVDGLDPAQHLALGRALAPLRDEGVLLIGSGMSFHNMRGFGRPEGAAVSEIFDAWLKKIALEPQLVRDRALLDWASAPSARLAHPREEHLLPLHVIAGAAGQDAGTLAFNGTFGGAKISAFRYG